MLLILHMAQCCSRIPPTLHKRMITTLWSQIIETLEVFEIVWNIPLNNGHSKIKKTDRYLKNSEVCELPRRDGRQGVLRSQINFTPEGHVHIR